MGIRASLAALILASLAAGILPASARAQSLGEIARREQERRKTIKQSGKVYSNEDLKPVPPPPAPADAAPATPADGTAAAPAAKDAGADAGKAAPDAASTAPKDQEYWNDRMKALETQLQRDQAFASALQVQIDALTTDFTNRDDPAQRAVIAENRQKALDELTRVRQAIEVGRTAIAALEEEARRAGVPPGWLR
jgi:hypothetical protein